MITKTILGVRRSYNEESGQVLPWIALLMVGFLGLAGLTIDVGHAYVAYDRLQASTNAAALAAAGATYNTSGATVTSQANLYGGDSRSGGKNASSVLGTVQTVATPECLNIWELYIRGIYLTPPGTTGCGLTKVANGTGPPSTACWANR
jgi:hypothetical protein